MKYNLPPFNEKVPRGYFEQSILDFSSDLFQSPLLGFALGITVNILYIYSFYKSKSCFSIIIYLFIAYLLYSIIFSKLFQIKRNK